MPPPAVPPSSPVEVAKFESFTQMGLPPAVTCFVPCAMSPDFAMFGYGMGTNGAGGAGVLQTSGKAIVTPFESALTIESLLTPTVTAIPRLLRRLVPLQRPASPLPASLAPNGPRWARG